MLRIYYALLFAVPAEKHKPFVEYYDQAANDFEALLNIRLVLLPVLLWFAAGSWPRQIAFLVLYLAGISGINTFEQTHAKKLALYLQDGYNQNLLQAKNGRSVS